MLGIDFDKQKINLAKNMVLTLCLSDDLDIINYAKSFGEGVVDSVIIATTSKDNSIINNLQECVEKKPIVLVGVTGLNMEREEFYKKELTFQVSCSYGPGRYDVNYETRD